jgi:acyl-CoA synthetase (AMP-forming)/AMP-acid ligase II
METVLYNNPIFRNLVGLLSKAPEKEFIFDYKGRSLTGEEILISIDSIAVDLAERGVSKGDRVVFLAQTSIESILYFFALTRVGACIILADPEMGQNNFISRLRFSEAKWMVQDRIIEKIDRFYFIKPILRFFNIWFPENLPISKNNRINLKSLNEIRKKVKVSSVKEIELSNTDDMAIIFTSGTTGTPKGVVHSFGSLYSGIKMINAEVPITETDYVYATQLYFLLIALNIPAKIYLSKNNKFKAKDFINLVTDQKITSTFLLPSEGQKIYEYCKALNRKLPESLKTILFGSAPVTQGFLSRFKTISNEDTKVYGVYGATEMLIISIVSMEEKINYKSEGDLLGKPLAGVFVKINEDSEILISGPQMYTRYLGDSDADFFNSGDLGKLDANNNIIILGRKKDMIIRNGYNLYPGIFENTISSIPGVVECAIVGLYNKETEDEEVVLVIVRDFNVDISESKLKQFLQTGQYSIDRQAIPDKIIFVKELPRSGRSNKIDKKKLRLDLVNNQL